MKTKVCSRDFGADVVRIYAVIMVLILHFFLRNGFYYRKMDDLWGILTMTMRSVSLCSVPLFVMLTGYLKCHKAWSGRYYFSLIPVLVSYTLISGLHLLFKIFYEGVRMSVWEWTEQFLGFELATYGWYVGMYIGLFLLTPLINKIWAACRNRREHLLVVLTLCAVTFLPATVNLLTDSDLNLMPAYFTKMYYIAYYCIGAYISTYRPRVRHGILWGIILFLGILISVINMCTRSDPANFYSGFSASYDHLLTAVLTVCTFLSLYRIECRNIRIRYLAAKLSGIVFELYLSSYLLDRIIFPRFDQRNAVFMYLPVGLWMVSAVFFGTSVIAWVINRITKRICRISVKT